MNIIFQFQFLKSHQGPGGQNKPALQNVHHWSMSQSESFPLLLEPIRILCAYSVLTYVRLAETLFGKDGFSHLSHLGKMVSIA